MNKGLKIGLIAGSVVLVLLLVGAILSAMFNGWGYTGWGMMGPGMMGGLGFGWFMPILAIVFWGLVIWGIVAFIRFLVSSSGTPAAVHTASAIEILKDRYARGEISREEFEEKRKDLL
jgi:putative membrane protein